jgi:MFS family permease
VAGTALAVPAAWLFSTLDSRSSIWVVLAATLGLGLGLGLVMQVMVLLVQNSVSRKNLGTATSTLTLLRQVGAAIGVAVLGSLITARFVAAVPAEVAARAGEGLNSLTPQLLAGLPAGDRAAVREAFGSAMPPVFGYAAIVLAAAFVLALFLPQRELRTVAFADDDGGGGAPARQRGGRAAAGPKRHRAEGHRLEGHRAEGHRMRQHTAPGRRGTEGVHHD